MCNTISFRGRNFPKPLYLQVLAGLLTAGRTFWNMVKGQPTLTDALPAPSLPQSLYYMQRFVPISSNSVDLYLQSCKTPQMTPNTHHIGLKMVIKTSKKTPSQPAIAPLDEDLLYIQTQTENNSVSLLSQGNV